MKAIIFLLSFVTSIALNGYSQGRILLSNILEPTRLYSIDGPLAGNGYWGQFFLGDSPNSLTPFLTSAQHTSLGWVQYGEVEVPNRPAFSGIYIQFWAWDGTVWGTDVQNVPMSQMGMTDTIPYLLWDATGYIEYPRFTQPAIVPPVPEPSVWVLVSAGGGLAVYGTRRLRKRNACSAIIQRP